MKFRTAIDSGAFSIFQKHALEKTKTRAPDFSYYSTPKFREYFDKYVVWLKKNEKQHELAVSLDVLYNPQMSWELYKEMRNLGLNPLPVLHGGEDIKWLKKYMDETDYIGIGGSLGTNLGKKQARKGEYRTWLTEVFKTMGPKYRAHGFAATDFILLRDFPWHSVDSARCWWEATMGMIFLPATSHSGGKPIFNYAARHPYSCTVTTREGRKKGARTHVNRMGEAQLQTVLEYLKPFGYTMEQIGGAGKEGYFTRAVVNAHYFMMMEKALQEQKQQDFHLYISGFVPGEKRMLPVIQKLKTMGVESFNFLGTFYDLKYFDETCKEIEHEKGAASQHPQTGGAGGKQKGFSSHSRPRLLQPGSRLRVR